jgi:hypothetical protein
MKKNDLINLIRENILEIGESSAKPYKYTLFNRDKEETIYTFELDDNPEYEGEIKLELDTINFDVDPYIVKGIMISFNVYESELLNQGNKVRYSATNLGLKTMFRIMSTVGEVLDETINHFHNKFDFIKIRAIGFELSDAKASSLSNRGDKVGQDQRRRLYDAFIRKRFKVINVKFNPSPSGIRGDIVWYLLENPEK